MLPTAEAALAGRTRSKPLLGLINFLSEQCGVLGEFKALDWPHPLRWVVRLTTCPFILWR